MPVVGETLSVETTPAGAATTGEYQWLIADEAGGDYTEIEDATDSTYTPVAGDEGKYIKVKITGKGNYRGTVTSDPVQVVTAYISTATPKAEVVGTVGWTRFAGTVQVGGNAENVKAYYIFEITEGELVDESVPQFFNYTNGNKGVWLPFGVEEIVENDHAKYRFGPPGGFDLDDEELPVKGQTEFQVNIEENITGKAYLVNADGETISNIVETTVAANPMPHAILSQVEEINQQVLGEEGYTRFAGTVQVADGVEDVNAYYVFEITSGNLTEESLPQYWEYSGTNNEGSWKNFATSEDGKYIFGDPNTGFPLSQDLPYNGQTEFQAKFSNSITVKAYLVNADESRETISNELTLILNADAVTEQDIAKAAIQPNWEISTIKGICDNIDLCEKPDEVMTRDGLPNELKNGNGVDVDYQVTIKTSYANKTAAKDSGRTVTTYFTIPDGVTVWYPVWEGSAQIYKSTAEDNNDEQFALGMVGHPLSAGNFDGEVEVYVALHGTTATEFEFNIKLVDAAEDWEDVVYGEDTLTITRSEYEFVVEDGNIEIPAIQSFDNNAGNKVVVTGNNGDLNEPGDNAYAALKTAVFGNDGGNESGGGDGNGVGNFLASYLIKVTLKAKQPNGDFGYTNKSVRIENLEVSKDENGNGENLKVYLYAHTDNAWYDLVQTGWGSTEGKGKGFNLYKDENTELEAYVFATEPGEYTVTFKAIDMSNGDAEICSDSVTITIMEAEDDNSNGNGGNGDNGNS